MRNPHVRTVLRNCYGNMDTLTNNFVTSEFIKGYGRVYQEVEVKILLLDMTKMLKIVV